MAIAHPSRYSVSDLGQDMNVTLRRALKPWGCRKCKATIAPSDRYAEECSEAYNYQSGHRYCIACAATFGYVEVKP